MALITRPATDAEAAATAIRGQAKAMIDGVKYHLDAIRQEVARVGRAQVATALGAADAAELLAFYSKAKDLVTSAGDLMDDLP